MRKTFRFKAIVNSETDARASVLLQRCRELYNLALEQRRRAFLSQRNSPLPKDQKNKLPNYYDQAKQLTELKQEFNEFRKIPAQAAQEVLERVHKGYNLFFSGLKAGTRSGLPRFKGEDRYHSFTLKQAGWKLEGKHLSLSGIGTFKLRMSREIKGDIKTITVSKKQGDWYVSFSCDNVPAVRPIGPAKQDIGLDLGITSFYADSEGNKVENPRHLKKSAEKLAAAQRALALKKRGSNNRKKCKRDLARKHKRVSDCRKDFHYKTALRLVRNFSTIVVEDLKIKNMTRNSKFSKGILDSGWGDFVNILCAKAEEAGRTVIKINPKNTSQKCSGCGDIVAKDISVRVHNCACGTVLDRDVNAAINILRLGQRLSESTPSRECSGRIPFL